MTYAWQRNLRTGVLGAVGAIMVLLLAGKFGGVALPGRSGFKLILLLGTAPTLFWWAWVDELLATAPVVSPAPHHRRMLRTLLGIYTIVVLWPVLMLVGRVQWYDRLPVVLLMWVMVWHLSMALAGTLGLVIWTTWLVGRAIRQRLVGSPADKNGVAHVPGSAVELSLATMEVQPPISPAGMSRRVFLYGTLAAAPMLVATSSVVEGLRQQGRFQIRHMQIPVPRLPARLDGLTITHLSDFHVGRYFRPEHLPRVVDAVNALGSDLIAVTGDIVDHSIEFLPSACDALQQMQSRYGRFTIVGNHDMIDSPDAAIDYLGQREPNLLLDGHTTINIGGERVQIGGLFWSRHDRPSHEQPGHAERVRLMMAGADPDVFTVALAHHPHAFDALADTGTDVVLAGHTHGGQVMLTPQGSPYPIGGGSLLFRYIWGEYHRGHSTMNVSAGVGNWFPVRVHAPAEIVQIRLVPAA